MKYFFAALAVTAAFTADASCLDYGPMSLTGRVVRQTYAGPPDFESVTKGDQPIVIYLLQLDYTLCIVESQLLAQNTREVQLEWRAGDPAALLGKKVTVTGELIRGEARHDKRVVMVAAEITQ
jgi:hypothetical protein